MQPLSVFTRTPQAPVVVVFLATSLLFFGFQCPFKFLLPCPSFAYAEVTPCFVTSLPAEVFATLSISEPRPSVFATPDPTAA